MSAAETLELENDLKDQAQAEVGTSAIEPPLTVIEPTRGWQLVARALEPS